MLENVEYFFPRHFKISKNRWLDLSIINFKIKTCNNTITMIHILYENTNSIPFLYNKLIFENLLTY